jgi:hypothetical protein
MTDQPIRNHRLGRDGPTSGTLLSVDTARDDDGQLYPVLLIKHADGSTRAVHFQRVDHIAKLAQAAPAVGDRVSVHLGGDLSTGPGPDNYGEEGMVHQPAADWSTWANRAYRRHPDNPRQIQAEAKHPEVQAPAGRWRRRVRMADGREGFSYDQPPVADVNAGVVPSRDGSGWEVKR